MLCIHYFVVIGIACLIPCYFAEEASSENENKNRFMNYNDWTRPDQFSRPPGFPNYGGQNQFNRYQEGRKPYNPSSGFGSGGSPARPPQFGDERPNQGNLGWGSNSGSSGLIFHGSGTNEGDSFTRPSSSSDTSSCERKCARTQEFNPVCGSDGNNYSNMADLRCAQSCGRRVSMSYYGNCRTTTGATRTTAKTPTGMLISPGRTGTIESNSYSEN